MSFGGGSSGSSKQVSTVSNAPWQPQQQPLKDMFAAAKGLTFNSDGSIKPIAQYQGQTYASMAPESSRALQAITARANAGSDVSRGANAFASDVLSGKYLNQTAPGWDAVVDKARSAVNGNYGAMGRSNSGSHDAAVSGEIGRLAYQDYANQLNLMNSVAGLSPQLAAADYADADRLNAVGAQRQQEGQNQITAAEAAFNGQVRAPFDALQAYQDFISGTYGGMSTSSQPIFNPSGVQQGIGTGLAALGTAANIYGALR